MDLERARQLLAQRRARQQVATELTADQFAEQRAFNEDPSQLKAALCGRRAGKTRGRNASFLDKARRTAHGRFLYINETRGEAKRLAWYGARGDGMASLCERHKLRAVCNESELTIRFPRLDSWIYLIGADDEAAIRKALGLPYHEVWWDEAQKIPAKFAPTIREVLMPTLLDYGGQMVLTGSPVRAMAGLFYEVTRPEAYKRPRGWSVHKWNLLNNPFFGATHEERWQRGIVGLQTLYGGPDVAPIDSPLMRREAFGEWVHEDAAYVYPVHRVDQAALCYAPARIRPDGYPDVLAAMLDLPGYPKRPYHLALGVDLGYSPDPFAWVLWAWSLEDGILYEVASYKRTHLTSDEQAALIEELRRVLTIGIVVADAGGGGKQVVAGWAKGWQDRYAIPVIEASKSNKHGAVEQMGNDLVRGQIRVREGGAWLGEARDHQWSSVVSSTGRIVEDPTTANHCLDAGLYAHRASYHHRYREQALQPERGSLEWQLREEREIEDAVDDEDVAAGAFSRW